MKSGKESIFLGKLVLVNSTIIHGKPVPPTHKKFEIIEVQSKGWKKFDEDIHSPGSYVSWPSKSTQLKKGGNTASKTLKVKIGITKKRKKQSQQSRKEKVAKMDDGNETTDNELDYEEEVESEEEGIDKDKRKEEKRIKKRKFGVPVGGKLILDQIMLISQN